MRIAPRCASLPRYLQYYNSANECRPRVRRIDFRIRVRVSARVRAQERGFQPYYLISDFIPVSMSRASVCYAAIWQYELPSVLRHRYPAVVSQNRGAVHDGRFNPR